LGKKDMRNTSEITRTNKQPPKSGLWMLFSIWQTGRTADKVLFIITAVAEYILVMHIGIIIGWFLGLWAGNVYFEYFPPQDSSKVFVLTRYGLIPHAFAKNGAIAGSFASIIFLWFINKRLFMKEVNGLYEEGITSSEEIAKRLGHSVQQVERTTRKLNKNIKQTSICVIQNKNESESRIASEHTVNLQTQQLESVSG
jgi:hypothetical protein